MTIGEREPLIVGDVEIDLDRVLLVDDRLGQGDRAGRKRAGEGRRFEEAGDGVDVGLGCVYLASDNGAPHEGRAQLVERRAKAATGGTRGRQVEAGEVFIGRGEEQPVLPDRAGNEAAVILLMDVVGDVDVGLGQRPVADVIARGAIAHERIGRQHVPHQARRTEEPEHRPMEIVAARLEDQVQGAAGEVAFLHVEGRGLDGDLLHRFQRDRAAVGRQAAGVEAEVVL